MRPHPATAVILRRALTTTTNTINATSPAAFLSNKQSKIRGPPTASTAKSSPINNTVIGSGSGAKGKTGGGDPLGSTSPGAPSRPKVFNSAVHLSDDLVPDLTEEQKREVDEHNSTFEKKHDRGMAAQDGKVDAKFWRGSKD
ncbi:hypothetical protein DCS_08040 [Drechmeria coniospora]|uniref:Uncharacterized protein n=1 Tax=Drechmeria coniospora TaxID=98403 RepID=A0A151GG65_DRECN|nr:hypothetical protein DCS_08040 [Drechmeria coniospora]KYK56074.1 hypothetical protein DCS_08040 [Drechmeria coniospora]